MENTTPRQENGLHMYSVKLTLADKSGTVVPLLLSQDSKELNRYYENDFIQWVHEKSKVEYSATKPEDDVSYICLDIDDIVDDKRDVEDTNTSDNGFLDVKAIKDKSITTIHIANQFELNTKCVENQTKFLTIHLTTFNAATKKTSKYQQIAP